MKNKVYMALVILIFVVGVGVLSYPLISSMLNNAQLNGKITAYADKVEQIDNTRYNELLDEAKKYNESLNNNVILTDPFDADAYYAIGADYNKTLNVDEDGWICRLEIPKIEVNLPVYHGTSDEVLQKGAGHLPNTSMPIGGSSTHCVIAAHTGMPTATMFDNLTDVEVGDVFYIHILSDVLKYQVDQVKVVLPEDTSDLRIIKGEDYVTLLTCTPYGQNTHRLLVRGKRVADDVSEDSIEEEYTPFKDGYMYLLGYKLPYWVCGVTIFGIVLFIVLVVVLIVKSSKKQGRHHKSNKNKGGDK